MASAARAPNASPSVLGPATTAPSTARYREARPAAWRPRGRGIADGHTNACPPAVGKALTGRERGAGARAHAHLFPRINSIHRHHLPARCGAENLFFLLFALVVDSSLTFFSTQTRRRAYFRVHELCTMLWRRPRRPGGRQRPRLALDGLSSARPDAHRSVFSPHRSPACGVQCNRSSPRFERGAPNFARALTFLPRNTCRFADFASGGLQRPQTTFPSC